MGFCCKGVRPVILKYLMVRWCAAPPDTRSQPRLIYAGEQSLRCRCASPIYRFGFSFLLLLPSLLLQLLSPSLFCSRCQHFFLALNDDVVWRIPSSFPFCFLNSNWVLFAKKKMLFRYFQAVSKLIWICDWQRKTERFLKLEKITMALTLSYSFFPAIAYFFLLANFHTAQVSVTR